MSADKSVIAASSIINSEATPKGGLKDGARNNQTDPVASGPVEFQVILQPEGTLPLANKVLFSAWLT